MSAINGDKSRYHRERKQKIARRKRTRELLERTPHQQKSVSVRLPSPQARCRHDHAHPASEAFAAADAECGQEEAGPFG